MSIKSWKEEFYPIPANEVPKGEELNHSIKKWTGFRPVNLKKHQLIAINSTIVNAKLKSIINADKSKPSYTWAADYPKSYFDASSENCALCVRTFNAARSCRECPIYKATNDDCDNAFASWFRHGDPIPMLDLLNQTKAFFDPQNQSNK